MPLADLALDGLMKGLKASLGKEKSSKKTGEGDLFERLQAKDASLRETKDRSSAMSTFSKMVGSGGRKIATSLSNPAQLAARTRVANDIVSITRQNNQSLVDFTNMVMRTQKNDIVAINALRVLFDKRLGVVNKNLKNAQTGGGGLLSGLTSGGGLLGGVAAAGAGVGALAGGAANLAKSGTGLLGSMMTKAPKWLMKSLKVGGGVLGAIGLGSSWYDAYNNRNSNDTMTLAGDYADGILSGASVGATFGLIGGPVGVAVGAAIGGIIGAAGVWVAHNWDSISAKTAAFVQGGLKAATDVITSIKDFTVGVADGVLSAAKTLFYGPRNLFNSMIDLMQGKISQYLPDINVAGLVSNVVGKIKSVIEFIKKPIDSIKKFLGMATDTGAALPGPETTGEGGAQIGGNAGSVGSAGNGASASGPVSQNPRTQSANRPGGPQFDTATPDAISNSSSFSQPGLAPTSPKTSAGPVGGSTSETNAAPEIVKPAGVNNPATNATFSKPSVPLGEVSAQGEVVPQVAPSGNPSAGLNANSKLGPTDASATKTALGIDDRQYNAFRQAMVNIESGGGKYGLMGGSSNRFAGAYQIGGQELIATAKRLGEDAPVERRGSDGKIVGNQAYLNDPKMQERYFDNFTANNHNILMKNPNYAALSPEKKLGVLGYAHNQGPGGPRTSAGAWNYVNTGRAQGTDAFGTSGGKYVGAIASQLEKTKGQVGGNNAYGMSPSAVTESSRMFGASGDVGQGNGGQWGTGYKTWKDANPAPIDESAGLNMAYRQPSEETQKAIDVSSEAMPTPTVEAGDATAPRAVSQNEAESKGMGESSTGDATNSGREDIVEIGEVPQQTRNDGGLATMNASNI